MCKSKKEMEQMLDSMPREIKTNMLRTWKLLEEKRFNQLRRERKLKECAVDRWWQQANILNLHDTTIFLEKCLADKGLKIIKMTKSENTAYNQKRMKSVKDHKRILRGMSEGITRGILSV